jgi:hypothetical protein
VTRALMLMAICLAGCASSVPRGPFYGDEKYLHFGLDPRAEADALIKQQSERFEPLALRVEGEHFTALGFMDRSGRATRVRVLTERGIELALDPEPESALTIGVRYALLAPPLATTHDADGDGFEELFVDRRADGANCLQVYRVLDVGLVDPVQVDAHVFNRNLCPNAVADLDADGRAELVVDVELSGFEGDAPHVRAPLWPAEHRFAPQANPAALARYVAAQRSARAPELAAAVRAHDFASCYRLSVELAALWHLLGRTPADQLSAFDRAMAGLVLTVAQQRSVMAAREQIFVDWNRPDAEPVPSDARPDSSELVHHAGP